MVKDLVYSIHMADDDETEYRRAFSAAKSHCQVARRLSEFGRTLNGNGSGRTQKMAGISATKGNGQDKQPDRAVQLSD